MTSALKRGSAGQTAPGVAGSNAANGLLAKSRAESELNPSGSSDRLPWYRSTLAIALLGSLLMWASLPCIPGFELWPLGWIAFGPWLWLARKQRLDGAHPYRALWLAGFLFFLANLHWLTKPHWTTTFGWLALSFYLAFYVPAFVWLTRIAVHRLRISIVVAAPIIWYGLELAKGHLLSGFTMGSIGHSQTHWLAVIQIADVLGGYGIGAMLSLVAACLVRMLPCDGRRWTFWPVAPVAAMFAIALSYGSWRLGQEPAVGAPTSRVALIQGSIDVTLKMDPAAWKQIWDEYVGLSEEAVRQADSSGRPIDVVVWPETMFRESLYSFDAGVEPPAGWPSKEEIIRHTNNDIAALAQHVGSPMLIGIDRTNFLADNRQQHFNSALFVDPNGRQQAHYDKMHPVMFGEYIPFADLLPWLYKVTPLPAGLTSGQHAVAEEVHGFRFSPDICYESTIPHLIRGQVAELREKNEEPDVLVNLTNDGWFWGSSELDAHLACAVMRSVECRKPLVIAANTGFSAWIDGSGRIIRQGPRRATGVILADVQRDPRRSWYLSYGDWPAAVCLLCCVGLAVVGLKRRGR